MTSWTSHVLPSGSRPGAALPGRSASSQRWSSRTRGCSSCAHRSWIAWNAFPARSAVRLALRSVCATATRQIGLVGLAVLSLLSDIAEKRPLVCIVDDAQWLDAASAQALAFVARRLGAESVGLVFAVREPSGERHLEGLPELAVGGLDDGDAQELLGTVLAGPLDERVRDRIVAETRGNPLALLELPRGRTPAELAGGFAGGFGPSGSPALPGRIEQSFRERLAPLPPSTRLLLLVAAAEPAGDPVLVWRAAAALGIGPDAAASAAARRAGAFSALPVALTDRALVELFSGRIAVAMSLAAESDAVVEATGSHLTLRTSIVLANWRGRDAEALALIEARREDVLRRGEGLWLAANDWGSAIRYNGLGRYEEALAAAEQAAEAARGLGPSILLLAELIEAAARSGQAERATGPLAQLAEIAHAAGTDWALGTHARATAMLAEGEAAERLYREAVERLSHVKTRATPRAPPLRRMAAARAPSRRRSQAAASRLRDALGHGHGGVRRARPPRAAGHRRDSAQAHGRDTRRADPAGGAGSAPGCRRADEPGDRCPAVPQSAHGGVAPGEGVRKARGQLPQGAPRGAVRRRRSGRPPLA